MVPMSSLFLFYSPEHLLSLNESTWGLCFVPIAQCEFDRYRGIRRSYSLLAFPSDWLSLRDTVSSAWDTWVKSNIGLGGSGWARLTV